MSAARRVLIDTSRNTVAIPCRSHRCLRIVVLVTAFFRGSTSYRYIRLYDFVHVVHGEIINFNVITGFCNRVFGSYFLLKMNSVSRCKIVYNVILVKVVESEFPINHARNCIVPILITRNECSKGIMKSM